MGQLLGGVWTSDDGATSGDGRYRRADSRFRDAIAPEEAEPGRFHLYVAIAWPWAHRTLIFRALKKLEDVVSLSFVSPVRSDAGWIFDAQHPDPLFAAGALHEIYTKARSDYTGRVTVPVLWDRTRHTIANNESAEIIRTLNSAFERFTGPTPDLYPEALRSEVDAINERVYHRVNNGVYRAGFARTQAAYDEAVTALFDTLDWLDQRLAARRFLLGDTPTEADWRLFTTLVRFDVAYVHAFKCNRRRLVDYPNLWPYARSLYQTPGVEETVDFEAYNRGYHALSERNPHAIVPIGPKPDWTEAHGR